MPALVLESPWSRRGPALVALAAFALHAACGGRYGIFRDELYFVACGERLAWGYVDQPPLVAAVARVGHALFGAWIPGLRLLPWLAAALTVYAAGRLAARLGAGGFGATLGALAVAAAPVLSGLGHYLTMNAFEPLLWTLLALSMARLLATGDPRAWYPAAVSAAVSFLFKYSVAPFAVFLVLGVALSPARRLLLSRHAALAAAFGLLLVLPNAAWQAGHGLPFLELVRNGQLHKNADFALGNFARQLVLQPNPLNLPIWTGGLLWLLASRAARPFRPVGIAALLQFAFLVATRAKPYYAAPLLPVLLGAGGAAVERALPWRKGRVASAGLLAAMGLAVTPAALPILPLQAYLRYQAALGLAPERLEKKEYGVLPQILADQFGWPALAHAVEEVARELPEEERGRALAFAQNYGEAGALELYGGASMPPVVSGHNQYWLWGLPEGKRDVVILIGDGEEECPGVRWQSRTLARRLPKNPLAMPYESGLHIWICRGPGRPLREGWPRTKSYE